MQVRSAKVHSATVQSGQSARMTFCGRTASTCSSPKWWRCSCHKSTEWEPIDPPHCCALGTAVQTATATAATRHHEPVHCQRQCLFACCSIFVPSGAQRFLQVFVCYTTTGINNQNSQFSIVRRFTKVTTNHGRGGVGLRIWLEPKWLRIYIYIYINMYIYIYKYVYIHRSGVRVKAL